MATPPPPKPWRAAAGAGETAVKSTPVADGSAVKPWDKPGAGQTPSGARTSERATRREGEGEGEGEGERGETDDDDDDDVRAIAPVATVNNPTGTTATPESRAWETTNRGTSHGASPSGYAGTTYGGAPARGARVGSAVGSSSGFLATCLALGVAATLAYASLGRKFFKGFDRTSYKEDAKLGLTAHWPLLYASSSKFRDEFAAATADPPRDDDDRGAKKDVDVDVDE